jgi:hypothetical protein
VSRPIHNRKIGPGADFRTFAPLYWDRGFRVLPLEPGAKRPAQELKGWPGYTSSPLSADKRAEFVNRYPDRGLGILTGTGLSDGYRLGAIDIDQDAFVPVVQAILGATPCAKRGKKGLIPILIDQNPWAHARNPMDMMCQGRSMRVFQA